ncbi:MAG: EamA family transporter [Candidatus Paceibacterota bacterium]|jgi:drug/metabolite transporter (DMT)-like permease
MSWILITIFAHLLSSVAYIFDKHIVTDTKLKPISYTFYSGIFQISYIALIPFVGFVLPENPMMILLGIGDGALFILALLVFYKGLKLGEASRVIPVVGASIPIFTASLAFIILNENLDQRQLLAFAFLVLGGSLISAKFKSRKLYAIKGLALAITSGFLFALYYTLMKLLYSNSHFASGFILIQIGGFLGALLLVLIKKNRPEIFSISKGSTKSSTSLFIIAKVVAAVAALMLNYAISIEGSKITVINALQAVQYIFLLIFAFILAKKMPSFLNEQFSRSIAAQKIVSVFIIAIGLYFLAF